MAEKDKKPKNIKTFRINFGISWIYILLLFGIVWMFFNQGGANPQKEEWAEVKSQWLKGDIKEIIFIRNKFDGQVIMRPDRIEKYADKFGGTVPKKSPHFIFSVTPSFNAEEVFEELNSQLPENERVKIVVETHESMWGILEWLIFPLFIILMWFMPLKRKNHIRMIKSGNISHSRIPHMLS